MLTMRNHVSLVLLFACTLDRFESSFKMERLAQSRQICNWKHKNCTYSYVPQLPTIEIHRCEQDIYSKHKCKVGRMFII